MDSSDNSKMAGQNDSSVAPQSEQEKLVQEMYKQNVELSVRNKTLSTLRKLYAITTSRGTLAEISQKIVDTIASELNFLSVRISLVDTETKVLRPIAISNSSETQASLAIFQKPLSELTVPLTFESNLTVAAVNRREKQITGNMLDVLAPQANQTMADEIARITQIKTIIVYPLILDDQAVGTLSVGIAKAEQDLSRVEHETLEQLIDVVTLAIDRVRLLDHLQDANERLKELDKLKSEFVSVASHELRTPMTAIKSYLWMALAGKGGPLNEKQRYYLERSYVSTDRLIKLVNDLLNVSRIESGRLAVDMQKVDIKELVDQVTGEVKPRFDEMGVKLIVGTSFQPNTFVLADLDKIKEVVINLIGNSLKFTKRDGTVDIEMQVNGGDKVTVSVTDNGEGISAEDLPKLFQKFGLVKQSYVTNQNAAQGTGLGLYISKSIVELHGGTIWAESEGKGKGATFKFTLPVYSDAGLAKAQENKNPNGLEIIHSAI